MEFQTINTFHTMGVTLLENRPCISRKAFLGVCTNCRVGINGEDERELPAISICSEAQDLVNNKSLFRKQNTANR